jgi:hypothetical protein
MGERHILARLVLPRHRLLHSRKRLAE